MSSVPSLECCQVNTAENSRYIASCATVDLSLRDSQVEQRLKALNSNAAPEKQRIYSYTVLDRESFTLSLDSRRESKISNSLVFRELFSFEVIPNRALEPWGDVSGIRGSDQDQYPLGCFKCVRTRPPLSSGTLWSSMVAKWCSVGEFVFLNAVGFVDSSWIVAHSKLSILSDATC